MNKKRALVIAVFSLIVSLLFNEYNLHLIRTVNPSNQPLSAKSIAHGQTVASVDDEYYVSPVTNYMGGKGWRRSPAVSNGDYFRRTPGYSLMYFVFVKTFGFDSGHLLLKWFQLLLFSFSVYLFTLLACNVAKNKTAGTIISLIYGATPLVGGWIYFTLTEAITPSLMVFYVYCLYSAYNSFDARHKNRYYLLASFFIGYLLMTRPLTGLAGLGLVECIISDYYYKTTSKRIVPVLKKLALAGIIPLVMIATWTIRNYALTHEIVFLEKAYHPQSLDRMKPEFEGMFSFSKCWGEDGAVFNTYHQPFYYTASIGDTSSANVQKVLQAWPPAVVAEFGYDRLYNIVRAHQQVIFEQKPYLEKQVRMPDRYLPDQLSVQRRYHELVDEYKKKHFLGYWLKAPLIYLKRMVFHSNTSQIQVFQAENRGKWYINDYRYLLVLMHIGIYLCFFINLALLKNTFTKTLFTYIPLLFIVFLIFVQREIEQRYMLPVLPLLLMNPVLLMSWIKSRWLSKQLARPA